MKNRFHVGAVGRRVSISNISSNPHMTPAEALELAAWLVATACPLAPGGVAQAFGAFHKMVADASEGELEGLALEAASELE